MSNIFQFIQVNPNQIIADTKAKYEQLAGYVLSPADVEMIMVQIMAYREQKILAKMEDVLHQSFVQLASGVALDYWGEVFGVERLPNEDDEDYRSRIMANNNLAPIGTRAAYIAKAKTAIGAMDCALKSKQEDNTMTPGMIKVSVLERYVDMNTGVFGGLASNVTNNRVRTALSDTKSNIIGDMFTFEDAIGKALNGSVTVRQIIGSNAATVEADVRRAVKSYINECSLKFKGTFDVNELQRRILNVADVFSIEVLDFPSIPVLGWNEYYKNGALNIAVV